jgi:hypothetical protein
MATGGFGVGKTYFAMTFPKWAYAQLEPAGLMTAKANPHLMENMVMAESFVPSTEEDIKDTFARLEKFCRLCREKAKAGEIETFILDNATYLSEIRWEYIEKYEMPTSTRSGVEDTRSAFRALGNWLFNFIIKEVISIPAHVVVTFHQMEETEVVTDDRGRERERLTGRIISDTLGRFRDRAPGLFSASLFLERHKFGNGFIYKAICTGAEGSGKPAKNNLGLPPEIVNISYQTIMEYLTKRRTAK